MTLRNVMSFLLSAGSNGLANGTGEFRRWLFGTYRSFVTPVRTVLYLLIALAVTVSLVAINTAIVTVAAARSPLVQAPSWLSDGFLGDLSTTFNVLLLFAGLFAGILVCSRYCPGGASECRARCSLCWPCLRSSPRRSRFRACSSST